MNPYHIIGKRWAVSAPAVAISPVDSVSRPLLVAMRSFHIFFNPTFYGFMYSCWPQGDSTSHACSKGNNLGRETLERQATGTLAFGFKCGRVRSRNGENIAKGLASVLEDTHLHQDHMTYSGILTAIKCQDVEKVTPVLFCQCLHTFDVVLVFFHVETGI